MNARPRVRDTSPPALNSSHTRKMRLKPQDSKKQLLEKSLEIQRAERSALADEINRLTASRNLTARQVEEEGKALMAGLRELESTIASKKSDLLNEIISLESRRKALMIPLDAIKEGLKEREKAIEAKEKENLDKEKENISLQSQLADKQASLCDQMTELDEKSKEIDWRWSKLQESEAFNADSTKSLSDKRLRFRIYEDQTLK